MTRRQGVGWVLVVGMAGVAVAVVAVVREVKNGDRNRKVIERLLAEGVADAVVLQQAQKTVSAATEEIQALKAQADFMRRLRQRDYETVTGIIANWQRRVRELEARQCSGSLPRGWEVDAEYWQHVLRARGDIP